MKSQEIRKIKDKYRGKGVMVNCDEYHAHSSDCLSGPEEALIIVKLSSEVLSLRAKLKVLAESIKSGEFWE